MVSFPGVGFITMPQLSWRYFEAASDVVQVGQRVSCEFLQFDATNGEARLFGVFVQVTKDIEGLVHLQELAWTPVEAPEEVVQVGDQVTVVVTEIDRERRRLALSRRQASTALE
ncbi:S1 RNA-binding domain-containing protein [Streptomyces sp. NBC_00347]|uniref:S1 RNA-binding domain-containing protein n=1 Tax=Streptomyces sp. NBC_00347 TaxID=2975721 RepID=UPI0022568E0E|nr:S1 RNA-binding domain-containing protein [Streptomyces sp. NBC_00347]MCX5128668.1 S1 RNA-binding domain-containing protein [Streptomyces sp. NBC_00347]